MLLKSQCLYFSSPGPCNIVRGGLKPVSRRNPIFHYHRHNEKDCFELQGFSLSLLHKHLVYHNRDYAKAWWTFGFGPQWAHTRSFQYLLEILFKT